ncbi:hypothetical protein HHL25_19650 [Rhizobium sp. S-51]|jgi:hypothetical protein|uniref:Uncharacterized protein n=1 Tax=Rhizobium terricola TaxID=2728849 RepID=A0A7Y0FXW0_9HYPH|nr:hypothetical protein [Rhizobium terricola]NML76351.1 hypothetical protein [Rhizobium terricola]
MTTNQNLMLYTKLAGFRLVVLANRFDCDTDVSRNLHDRLLEGLEAAAGRIRTTMALERSVLAGDDEYAAYRLEGETEIFGRFTIILLDELDIDYPELVPLTEQDLGSLAPILKDITRETGIAVSASRVSYIRCPAS